MKIILGVKKINISSSENNSDGYTCSSDDVNSVDILFSGTEEKAQEFVTTNKANLQKLNAIQKEYDKLEDESYNNMSEDEYFKKLAKLDTKKRNADLFQRYANIIIVDGEIIK